MTKMFCSRHRTGWDSPPCPALCPVCQDDRDAGGKVAHHDLTDQERADCAGHTDDTPRINYAGSCGTSALTVEAKKIERELTNIYAYAEKLKAALQQARDGLEQVLDHVQYDDPEQPRKGLAYLPADELDGVRMGIEYADAFLDDKRTHVILTIEEFAQLRAAARMQSPEGGIAEPTFTKPEAPAGWRLVPIRPTDAMLAEAARYHLDCNGLGRAPRFSGYYARMLDAAPAYITEQASQGGAHG